MKRMKFFILLFILFSSGCGSKDLSSTNKVSSNLLSSSSLVNTSSYSIINSSSSDEIVKLEKVKITILNNLINPNDEVKYEVKFIPQNASNQEYKLSTSTPDILLIKELKVYAKKVGIGKLKIESIEGQCFDIVDVKVVKRNPYSIIIDKLSSSIEKEKNNASKVHSSYVYDSELYSNKEELDWYIFEDSIQKNIIENNNIKSQQLNYLENNFLKTLKVENYNTNVILDKIPVGDASNAISYNEAIEKVSLVEYNNNFGVSNYLSSLLKDELTFYKDEIVDYVELNNYQDNGLDVYEINGECSFLNSYLDNVDSLMRITSKIYFNNDGSLNKFKYKIEKYTPDENDYIDLLIPTSKEEFDVLILYLNRTENLNQKINIEDYEVTNFEIDDSKFTKDNGINIMNLGETIKLSIIEFPEVHLPEKYTLEILESFVIKEVGDLEIKAVGCGTTIVKVISSLNIEKEITIKVQPQKVESISLGYIPYFIEVGDVFEVSATCSPLNAKNKEYEISIKNGDQDKATITKKDNGNYEFKALAAGTVTIIATSSENNEISDEKTVTIQEKPDLNNLKEKLTYKTYYHHSSTESSELVFNIDGTGSLILEGGGEYTFNWDLDEDLYFTFTNVVAIKSPDRWYDFRGKSGSNTDRNCTMVNLYIYDLDYEESVALQFN